MEETGVSHLYHALCSIDYRLKRMQFKILTKCGFVENVELF